MISNLSLSCFLISISIIVWYGSSFIYSIELQTFLNTITVNSERSEEGSDARENVPLTLSGVWLLVISSFFVVTVQSICCTTMEISVWIILNIFDSFATQNKPSLDNCILGNGNSSGSDSVPNAVALDDDQDESSFLSQATQFLIKEKLRDNNLAWKEEVEIIADSNLINSDVEKVGENPNNNTGNKSHSLIIPLTFTSRTIVLSAYSGLATLLQTFAYQLSNVACVNIIRVLEPVMAALFLWLVMREKGSWQSSIGLIFIVIACIGVFSNSGSCSMTEGNERIYVAIACGLIINCCMIGRNSVIKLLPKENLDDNKLPSWLQFGYRFSRVRESISYYVTLLLIMLFLSFLACITNAAAWDFYHDLLTVQHHLLLPLIYSSLMFAVYNYFSLIVCESVNLTTHSILTAFKRPILVLIFSLYFFETISLMQTIACIFIAIGMSLHLTDHSRTQPSTNLNHPGEIREPTCLDHNSTSISQLKWISFTLIILSLAGGSAMIFRSLPSVGLYSQLTTVSASASFDQALTYNQNNSTCWEGKNYGNSELVASLQSKLMKEFIPLFQPFKCIVLFDHPDHDNRGDSAIWMGEISLLQLLNIKIIYQCTVFRHPPDPLACKRELALEAIRLNEKNCESATVIGFHGGGNMGDLWGGIEIAREDLIATTFREYPVLIFPQTVYFQNQNAINRSQTMLNQAANLLICVRDSPSFSFVQNYYPLIPSILMPDMAFMMGHHPRVTQPIVDILFLLRTDKEAVGNKHEQLKLWIDSSLNLTESSAFSYQVQDWHSPIENLPLDDLTARSSMRVSNAFSILEQGRVVISDRLHAHILGTMADIPHIMLDNTYGKVSSFHLQWLKQSRGAFFANKLEEAIEKAKEILTKLQQRECDKEEGGDPLHYLSWKDGAKNGGQSQFF